MIKDAKTNALKTFDFSHIVTKIPELQQLNCQIESISFDSPIDSSNMDTKYYVDILEITEKNINILMDFFYLNNLVYNALCFFCY